MLDPGQGGPPPFMQKHQESGGGVPEQEGRQLLLSSHHLREPAYYVSSITRRLSRALCPQVCVTPRMLCPAANRLLGLMPKGRSLVIPAPLRLLWLSVTPISHSCPQPTLQRKGWSTGKPEAATVSEAPAPVCHSSFSEGEFSPHLLPAPCELHTVPPSCALCS